MGSGVVEGWSELSEWGTLWDAENLLILGVDDDWSEANASGRFTPLDGFSYGQSRLWIPEVSARSRVQARAELDAWVWSRALTCESMHVASHSLLEKSVKPWRSRAVDQVAWAVLLRGDGLDWVRYLHLVGRARFVSVAHRRVHMTGLDVGTWFGPVTVGGERYYHLVGCGARVSAALLGDVPVFLRAPCALVDWRMLVKGSDGRLRRASTPPEGRPPSRHPDVEGNF